MLKAVVRGGGDLGSGVSHELYRAGHFVVVLEIGEPRCIRRPVCFANAVYEGGVSIEGIEGRLVSQLPPERGEFVPVMVDAHAASLEQFKPAILVDARMLKRAPLDTARSQADLVIGLGPGYCAGGNCHAVIETVRGENLGKAYTVGCAEADTGLPGDIGGYTSERLLRSPATGVIRSDLSIGCSVEMGDTVATVDGHPVRAQIRGVLRGLIKPGLVVKLGEKIGDIDPRCDRGLCFNISDKAKLIGRSVVQTVMDVTARRQV